MLPTWVPDVTSLDLLLTVAKVGSVAQAAGVHGLSQPSASARLSRLERQLGVSLLVRSSSGSTLTPAGEAVAAWARGVVEATHMLTDGVLTLRAATTARLRVAASLTVAEYLMPPWLLALRRRHPELEVAASVENSHEVAAKIRSGEADVGFIESPDLPPGVTGQQVGSDRIALVVARSYPLAARAETGLRAAQLPDLPLLVRESGSGTRDTFLHAMATALHRSEAPPLPYAVTLGSTATIIATTRAGGGVGVLSARAVAADLASGELVEVRVADLDLIRPLTAIWLGRRPSMLAQELMAIAAAAH